MILKDITDLLIQTIRNAHVVNDERIDPRLLQDWVMLKRNNYIKNYINQKGSYEQNTLQFELLDVAEIDTSLSLGGVSLGKRILRSDECPTMLEGRAGVATFEITTADIISKTIAVVPMDRLRWCGNGKVNKDMLFAGFYDGRFYIKSGSELYKPLTKIRVVGIFADPTQVSTYSATDDYPVNNYMIDYFKSEIIKDPMAVMIQLPSDEQNDSTGKINIQ